MLWHRMARLFTSKTEESEMMALKLGWDFTVVLPVKDAVTVAEILSKALTWEEKYEKGDTLYFAYPNAKEMTMKIVPDELVGMARLAGKPGK